MERQLEKLKFKTVVVSRNRDGKFGFDVKSKQNILPRVVLEEPGPAYISQKHMVDNDAIISVNGVNVVLESNNKVRPLHTPLPSVLSDTALLC